MSGGMRLTQALSTPKRLTIDAAVMKLRADNANQRVAHQMMIPQAGTLATRGSPAVAGHLLRVCNAHNLRTWRCVKVEAAWSRGWHSAGGDYTHSNSNRIVSLRVASLAQYRGNKYSPCGSHTAATTSVADILSSRRGGGGRDGGLPGSGDHTEY